MWSNIPDPMLSFGRYNVYRAQVKFSNIKPHSFWLNVVLSKIKLLSFASAFVHPTLIAPLHIFENLMAFQFNGKRRPVNRVAVRTVLSS